MGNLATRRARTATALLALLAVASAAHAGEIDKTGRPELSLTVVGEIDQHCGLAAIPSQSLGDLTQPTISADADVALQCNVPFSLLVRSVNGGLRNVAHPHGVGGYSGVRAYHLSVAMPVRLPGSQTVTADYSAADLVGGKSISSQGGVAFDGAHIHMDLDQLTAPGLAAGNYVETIEFSILPLA
ncbi:MAG TPA: hypothetical protein VHW60_10155 [Caulobacteraceae bacterium]|jgi:hypothetical protein|nr:hypothetical protein [Caulobacteraceae bacterium]